MGRRIRAGSSRVESADQIRNEPVLGPITSANDVASARCSEGHMVFVQAVERERMSCGMPH